MAARCGASRYQPVNSASENPTSISRSCSTSTGSAKRKTPRNMPDESISEAGEMVM